MAVRSNIFIKKFTKKNRVNLASRKSLEKSTRKITKKKNARDETKAHNFDVWITSRCPVTMHS